MDAQGAHTGRGRPLWVMMMSQETKGCHDRLDVLQLDAPRGAYMDAAVPDVEPSP